jgi:AhpD family alkylhydroperoxidase
MPLAPPATNRQASKRYVHQTGLDRGLLELVGLRASLINGYACCADMHTEVARTSGSP